MTSISWHVLAWLKFLHSWAALRPFFLCLLLGLGNSKMTQVINAIIYIALGCFLNACECHTIPYQVTIRLHNIPRFSPSLPYVSVCASPTGAMKYEEMHPDYK